MLNNNLSTSAQRLNNQKKKYLYFFEDFLSYYWYPKEKKLKFQMKKDLLIGLSPNSKLIKEYKSISQNYKNK